MSKGDLYAVSAGLFWSGSVILMRISGFQIPPVPLTFFKSCVAIVGFAAVSLLYAGEPLWPDLSTEQYLRLVVSGVLGITIADTMFAAALNRLGASLQALADCIYAPAMALVGYLMFSEVLGPWELIGGILVVSGVAVGIEHKNTESPKNLYTGIALAAGAHIIMALGILYVRDVLRSSTVSLAWISGFRFAVATIVLGTFALARGQKDLFLGFKRVDTWKTSVPMAILGPFIATLLWVAGFKYLETGRAAIYNQLSTVFIIILAYFILKEKMTKRKAIGVVLAVAGALMVALQEA